MKDNVERYFLEVLTLLKEDGHAPDSVIVQTAQRLGSILAKDGFSVPDEQEDVVRAFMVAREADGDIVASVFAMIPGWEAKVLKSASRAVVVVGNVALSKENIKAAISGMSK